MLFDSPLLSLALPPPKSCQPVCILPPISLMTLSYLTDLYDNPFLPICDSYIPMTPTYQ